MMLAVDYLNIFLGGASKENLLDSKAKLGLLLQIRHSPLNPTPNIHNSVNGIYRRLSDLLLPNFQIVQSHYLIIIGPSRPGPKPG